EGEEQNQRQGETAGKERIRRRDRQEQSVGPIRRRAPDGGTPAADGPRRAADGPGRDQRRKEADLAPDVPPPAEPDGEEEEAGAGEMEEDDGEVAIEGSQIQVVMGVVAFQAKKKMLCEYQGN